MRIGKITENALKRSVLKLIKTEFKNEGSAAAGSDCAFSNGKKTFSTICPVTVDIEDAAFYGVIKAVNGLVAQGITAEQVLMSILLPENAEEPQIKKYVNDAIEAAILCNVIYSGGHTEVTSLVNRPVLNITAIGYLSEEALTDGKRVTCNGKGKPGQSLVITKCVALEGTAMLAWEKFDELTAKYPVPFIDGARNFKYDLYVQKEMDILAGSGVSAVHDLSNGGVFAGLWELAGRSGCGLRVDLKNIPIRQETIEICEFFEINPYQLLSGGALLIAADDGEKLVFDLNNNGIPAKIVGELTDSNDKIIINADETRFLEAPQADEILKVL